MKGDMTVSEIELKSQEIIHVNEGIGKSFLSSKTIGENNLQSILKFKMQKKFRDFGLTKHESKIYMFLSKNGPKKAIEISKDENIPRTETYHLLSNLKNKGIITPSLQIRPQSFSAVAIDKAMELLIDNQKKKIEKLKSLKDDMAEIWNSFHGIIPRRKSDFNNFKSKN